MDSKQKIKAYFVQRQNDLKCQYKIHQDMQQGEREENARKYHNDMAWAYGVSLPQMLDKMEKDLLRFV
jgi:hypothetical protein